MSDISALSAHSSLSFAAYADMTGSLQRDLISAGMSDAQASIFAGRWTVVEQFSGALGLSATVFQEISSGAHCVAIRGSQSPGDFGANYILANGFPAQMNPQFTSLRDQINLWTANGVLPSIFTVTGHSLGGYLADAVALQFGARVSGVYTYNAPGVDGYFSSIVNALREALGVSGIGTLPNLANVRGTAGWPAIAGLGNQVAPPRLIETESSIDPIANHSIVGLTDSLAVYELYSTLAPSLSADSIKRIVQGASSIAPESLEKALDQLRAVFLGESTLTSGKTATGEREQYYSNIRTLTKNGAFLSLAGKVKIESIHPGSASTAHGDFAALVSLITGANFSVRSLDAAAVETALQGAHAAAYADWQADRQALASGAAAETLNFTDTYLNDRSALLNWRNVANTADESFVNSPLAPADRTFEFHWREAGSAQDNVLLVSRSQSGAPAQVIAFGGDGADPLTGNANAKLGDRLYGGGGDDTIAGLAGDDYLEGNAGNDTLDGGDGGDRLLGGAGNDTYVFTGTFGKDTITDSDGSGQITLDDTALTGTGTVQLTASENQPYTVWEDKANANGPITYRLNTSSSELTITAAGGSITVKNFQSGHLGISAPEAPAPAPAPVPQTIFNLSSLEGRDAFGAAETHLSSQDLRIEDAATAFNLYEGQPQPPVWRSTAVVRSGTGADVIEGGIITAVSDILMSSGAADDRLYATVTQSLDQAIERGEDLSQAVPETSRYVLDAGSGRDQVIGGDASDVLFGGEGDDTLVGGLGNDFIIADGSAGAMLMGAATDVMAPLVVGANDPANGIVAQLHMQHAGLKLGLTLSDTTGGRTATAADFDRLINPLSNTDLTALQNLNDTDIRGRGYTLGDGTALTADQPIGGDTDYAAPGTAPLATNKGSGDDIIFAGAGDDVVNAGAGDDLVVAGSGKDIVAGYEGDDFITGGEGDDRLMGDLNVLPPSGVQTVEEIDFYSAKLVIRNTLDAAVHGQDYIDGGDGVDIIFGGGKADELFGGADNDTILGDDIGIRGSAGGDDYLDGEEGDDNLFGGAGQDQLEGGAGMDLLVGDMLQDDNTGGAADYLNGDDGNDRLWGGAGADTLLGGAGADTLRGDAVADETKLDPAELWLGTPATSAQAGDDYLDGEDGDDWLYGEAGNDILLGGSGNDSLDGGDGNDSLVGGEGSDGLRGGAGNDTYTFAAGDGAPGGIDAVVDTEGENTIRIEGASAAQVDVAVPWNSQKSLAVRYGSGADGSAAENWIVLENALNQKGIRWIEIDGQKQEFKQFVGERLMTSRSVFADADGLSLLGGAAADGLYLVSNDGEAHGGRGDDFIYLGGERNKVTVARGDGNDTLQGAELGSSYSNNTLSFEGAIAKSDVLVGRGENGAVVLAIRDAQTSVAVEGGIGQVSFQASGQEVGLGALVQETLDAQATAGDDVIEGSLLSDRLDGGAGNDILIGYEGNDTLMAVGGDDILIGGTGDDTYLVGAGAGSVRLLTGLGAGEPSYYAGQDRIVFAGSRANSEWTATVAEASLVITVGVAGSATPSAVRLEGYFDSGASAEAWSTATFEFADGSFISQDEIRASLSLATDSNDVINGFDGVDAIEARAGDDIVFGRGGNDALHGDEGDDILYGNDGDDLAVGGDGADLLSGGEGADTLRGGGGADVLTGEAGNDVLEGDAQSDTLFGGVGADSLDGGADDDTLFGGESSDYLAGGDGHDLLHGGAGADFLQGGAGEDTYVIATAGFEANKAGEVDVLSDTQGADVIRIEGVSFSDLRRIIGKDGGVDLLWRSGVVNVRGGDDALTRIAVETDDGRNALGEVLDMAIPVQIPEDDPAANANFVARYEAKARSQIIYAASLGALAWRNAGHEPLGEQLQPILTDAAETDVSRSSYRTYSVPYTYTVSGYRDAEGNVYASPMTTTTTTRSVGTVTTVVPGIRNADGSYQEPIFTVSFTDVPVTTVKYTPGLTYFTEQRVSTETVKAFLPAAASVDATLGDSRNAFAFSAGLVRGGAGDDVIQANINSFSRNYYAEHTDTGEWVGRDHDLTVNRIEALSRRNLILLTGQTAGTWLDGGDGNDTLYGSEVGDILYGGKGVNRMEGGQGPDRYLVLDEGADQSGYAVIHDVEQSGALRNEGWEWYGGPPAELLPAGADIDTVEFGPGIRLEELTLDVVTADAASASNRLIVGTGGRKLAEVTLTSEQLALDAPANANHGAGVEFFEFQNGQKVAMADVLALARAPSGPQLLRPLADAAAYDNQLLAYVIPIGSFYDPRGGTLSYSATLADGSPLPSWLQLVEGTAGGETVWQLVGTPPDMTQGVVEVRVTATNAQGASISDSMELAVSHLNRAPIAAQPFIDQNAVENQAFVWTLPAGAFSDPDAADVLTWAFAPDSADAATWLQFDPATRTLSGTPPYGTLYPEITGTVTATDPSGTSVSQRVSVHVTVAPGVELLGTDGDDTLIGTVGGDTLNGGLGNDIMRGGKGADIYHVDSTYDTTVERAGEGVDTVIATVDWRLSGNVDNLTLANGAADGAGNALNNTILGNDAANKLTGGGGDDTLIAGAGDDWLRGGAGADQLRGGTGNDLYEVDHQGDTAIEFQNEGVDTLESSVSYSLGDHVENLILTGTLAIDGNGNSLDNLVQGNDAANTLSGAGGNDTLNGKRGEDTLIGGLGNDSYILEDDLDFIVEEAGAGRDSITSRVSVTLAANVEDGILLGAAVELTGNALSNMLVGNNAANVIDGQAGADVMIGGKGSDRYVVDSAADTIIEHSAEGLDTVEASVNYVLGENLERLTLTGNAEAGMGNAQNNKMLGNAASNKLFGEAGSDELDGAEGADILVGGIGNDKYYVDSSDDLVVEAAEEGVDTLYASISFALADNVERLTLTGSSNINAVGNAGNNRLEGNAGNNVLFGGLGNDTYVFGRGSGQDIVVNFDAGKPSGDKVQLGAGIVGADVSFVRRADDLVLRISGTSNQLTVVNYFAEGGKGPDALEKVRFEDGTYLTHSAVLARSVVEAEPSDAAFVPPAVRAGDASSLYTAPVPEATAPNDRANPVPQSISESIASARARFEQGLQTLRTNTDDQGTLKRNEFVERRALPLLWNLQDALLNLQLAKNPDGRFATNASVDSRMARDVGLTIDMLSAVPGSAGRLDQMARLAEVKQFDLAQLQ